MKRLGIAVPLLSLALAAFAGCGSGVTGEDLIRLEGEFAEALASGDAERFGAFLSEDVVGLGAGGSISDGRDDFLREWQPLIDDPSTQWTWKPLRATVSASGDMGFTYGEWRMTRASGDGSALLGTGRYVSIWRLEDDGVWRVVLDGGNADATPRAERSF